MNQDFESMLAETLADRRVSRNERHALGKVLEDLQPSNEQLSHYRRHAFQLAEKALDHPDAGTVIDWLQAVMKLLAPATSSAPAAAEAYFTPGDDAPVRISRLLKDARRTVDVCVFTVTDNRITTELEAAHGRGVKVRIVSDDDKSQDLGSDIDRLRQKGIAVRVDRSPFHMHHKFAIFDQQLLLTGSYNWTRGAAQDNHENFIVIGDRSLVSSFSATFEKLWESFA